MCVCLSSRSDPIRLLPSRRRWWRDSSVSQWPWCVPHTLCLPATTLLSADVHLLNGKHTQHTTAKRSPAELELARGSQQGKAGKKKDKGEESKSGEEVVHDEDDDDYDAASDGNKATKEREKSK